MKEQTHSLGEKFGVSFSDYHENLMPAGCWWGDSVSKQMNEESLLFLTEAHLL